MELMHRHSGATQGEIEEHLEKLNYTVVSRERKRDREKIERDSRVGQWYTAIQNRLSLKITICH